MKNLIQKFREEKCICLSNILSVFEARNNAKPFFISVFNKSVISVFNKSGRLRHLRSIKPIFKALLLLSCFHMLSPTLSPSGPYLHYPVITDYF